MLTGAGVAPAVLAAVVLLVWPGPRSRVTARLRALRPPRAGARTGQSLPEDTVRRRGRRWFLPVVAGAGAWLLLGGVAGVLAGAAVVAGGDRLLRRRPAEEAARAGELVRDLPVACDLLAVCLAAGVPVGSAVAAVGGAVPRPLGAELQGVAELYRLGADARSAWAGAPAALDPLGRVLVRAGTSGASVAPALRSLAADLRAEARSATESAVRRSGIWILAPLGACFLPGFVCLGVAPLVLGIAADVFG